MCLHEMLIALKLKCNSWVEECALPPKRVLTGNQNQQGNKNKNRSDFHIEKNPEKNQVAPLTKRKHMSVGCSYKTCKIVDVIT